MLFSILIPTLACRAPLLARLRAGLDPQVDAANAGAPDGAPRVEIVLAADDGENPIGWKRNKLLDEALGSYIAFVDDDDVVSANYVPAILSALCRRSDLGPMTPPDCVGFRVARCVDGRYQEEAIHSLRYAQYGEGRDAQGQRYFERTPNHLNPVRAELARRAMFPSDLNWAEDTAYAQRLRPLLRTEVFVDERLYTYLYRTWPRRRGERTNHGRVKSRPAPALSEL